MTPTDTPTPRERMIALLEQANEPEPTTELVTIDTREKPRASWNARVWSDWNLRRSRARTEIIKLLPAILNAGVVNNYLLELLAVIHRDGGHYVEEHGLEKAVADALRLSSERVAGVVEEGRCVRLIRDMAEQHRNTGPSFGGQRNAEADAMDRAADAIAALKASTPSPGIDLAEVKRVLEPFARVAEMEAKAEVGASVFVNVERCRDARTLYAALANIGDGGGRE